MNIRKAVNLLAVALCLAAWAGFAGARQDFPKEKRTPEFSITFEVSFAKPFDTSVCIQGLGSHALDFDGWRLVAMPMSMKRQEVC